MKSSDDSIGLCPICRTNDGFINTGRTHVGYCKEHKKSWLVGSNLFSNWRNETEEEQRCIWADVGMDDFEVVEPYFHPREDDSAEVEAQERRLEAHERRQMVVERLLKGASGGK
jgi:hypothetical protein